jgi:hypothetical protein
MVCHSQSNVKGCQRNAKDDKMTDKTKWLNYQMTKKGHNDKLQNDKELQITSSTEREAENRENEAEINKFEAENLTCPSETKTKAKSPQRLRCL